VDSRRVSSYMCMASRPSLEGKIATSGRSWGSRCAYLLKLFHFHPAPDKVDTSRSDSIASLELVILDHVVSFQ